jgi:hypothetical protein
MSTWMIVWGGKWVRGDCRVVGRSIDLRSRGDRVRAKGDERRKTQDTRQERSPIRRRRDLVVPYQ